MEIENALNVNEISRQVLSISKESDAGNTVPECKGSGIALLKTFSPGFTKNGNSKYSGILVNKSEVRFNSWQNTPAYNSLAGIPPESKDLVVKVSYTVSKYGMVVYALETVSGFDPDDFLNQKYDESEQEMAFDRALASCKATPKAVRIIRAVLHLDERDDINERVIKEYAAMFHHDNCAGGLFAHTIKCLNIYAAVKGEYEFLSEDDSNDLMIIGISLHDIGKIFEMHNGVYQPTSFLTHRGLGFEYLMQYKELIVDSYDEEFYYMVCSVILQHHGEYGENPKTLYAMLVHIIDEMEASLTGVEETLENNTTIVDSSGKKIRFNDTFLNVLTLK